MNFYKHHLGDYDGHTAHLSWDEDMAYTRLLRVYYRREEAIPDAEKYRLARAASKSHRGAVDRVLSEFFTLVSGLWRQKRADMEIQTYQTQCQKNREVGKLGGRPKKTEVVSTDNRIVTEVVSRNNPNQNQIPEPDTRKESSAGSAPKNGARHALDTSEILITLPLREGGDFEVRHSLVAEVEPLCPAVDVPATLKEMKLWLVGNPDRRKTRKGIKRFITTWLNNEQAKHGG